MKGLASILTLIFIVLKLTGLIAWSWWWVLSPMILAFALVFMGVVGILIIASSGGKKGKK